MPTHENQFLVFFHMAEKIKMRQVEEEYWKFTDTSGVGNATNAKSPMITPTPIVQQGVIRALPEEQKDVIEQWVGDMKSNVLGLQPRTRNIVNKIDESSVSPGISRSTNETGMSVRSDVQQLPLVKTSVVQLSSTQGPESTETIPENTFVQILPEESNVWSGTTPRS
jgi:hypothetical protein